MLTEAELDRYSKAALDGDGNAAFRIYLHYQMGTDLRNAEFWVHIAAENGNLSGMINYADYLLDTPRAEQCRRARFWIKRAKTLATSESDRSSVQMFERKLHGKCASLIE
jgi:TPR repeat protein